MNGSSSSSGGGGGGGNNGAWGSVSYSSAEGDWNNMTNWMDNLTTDQYLEMMLGPRQVRPFANAES